MRKRILLPVALLATMTAAAAAPSPAVHSIDGQPAPDLFADIDRLRSADSAFIKAQTAADEDLKFIHVPAAWRRPDNECRAAWSSLSKLVAQFDSIEKEYQGASGKAGISFSNDRSGAENRSKAGIDAQLRAGTYPDEVRLRAAATLDFQSGRAPDAITEDVTEILLNYDHFFTPVVEGFTFMERFTDTFMSIDQRYEVGVGAKLEWNSDALTRKGTKDRNAFNSAIDGFEQQLQQHQGCLTDATEQPLALPASLADGAIADAFHQAISKQLSRYQAGISLAILADFEQADSIPFQTTVPGAAAVNRSLKPPGLQRYRLSLRPSWRINFTDGVSWDGQFFYKPALDSPRRVGGERDYRMEAKSELKWTLAQIGSRSKKNVTLSLLYSWRYDSAPPSIDALVTDFITPIATAAGIEPEEVAVSGRLRAERRHSLLRLNVSVDL